MEEVVGAEGSWRPGEGSFLCVWLTSCRFFLRRVGQCHHKEPWSSQSAGGG